MLEEQNQMKVGDLYRICETSIFHRSTHSNLFIMTGRIGYASIVGVNLNTGKKHHYSIDDLEKI